MTSSDLVTVTTTIDDEDKAAALARSAVEARLAACAQVGGPVTSVYWWEGAIEEATEYTVTFKTTGALADVLVAHVSDEHAYDIPEIIVTPVSGGNAAYLTWVGQETTTPPV